MFCGRFQVQHGSSCQIEGKASDVVEATEPRLPDIKGIRLARINLLDSRYITSHG
jgi:hypothetical protein